jgi:hypothetical protein
MTKENPKKPEQNVWGLFGKVAGFIGALVVGSIFIDGMGKK